MFFCMRQFLGRLSGKTGPINRLRPLYHSFYRHRRSSVLNMFRSVFKYLGLSFNVNIPMSFSYPRRHYAEWIEDPHCSILFCIVQKIKSRPCGRMSRCKKCKKTDSLQVNNSLQKKLQKIPAEKTFVEGFPAADSWLSQVKDVLWQDLCIYVSAGFTAEKRYDSTFWNAVFISSIPLVNAEQKAYIVFWSAS